MIVFGLAVIFQLGCVSSVLGASNISANIDDTTRKVTVEGRIPSEQAGKRIMLFVINPGQTIENLHQANMTVFDYWDFKVTDTEGHYHFEYTLDANAIGGNYTVRVGAGRNEVSQPAIFYYADSVEIANAVTAVNHATAQTITSIVSDHNKALKLDLTGVYNQLSASGKANVFAKITGKGFINITTLRNTFNSAAEQEKHEEEIQEMVEKINNANEESMADLLLSNSQALGIVLNDEYELYKDQVCSALAKGSFSNVEDIKKVFMETLGLAVVNGVPYGNRDAMLEAIKNYSDYIHPPSSYNNLSEDNQREICKNLIGQGFISVQALYDKIDSCAKSVAEGTSVIHYDSKKSSGTKSEIRIDLQAVSESIVPKVQKNFIDLGSVPWAQESISSLAELGIIEGVDSENFHPNDNVTREQFIKMLVIGLRINDDSAKCTFSDVKEDEWYYQYVAIATKAGIVNGVDADKFGVGKEITRQDMAVMAYRALKTAGKNIEKPISETDFIDVDTISSYALEAISKMKGAQIINGMDNNRFVPMDSATRAMSATVIYKLIQLL